MWVRGEVWLEHYRPSGFTAPHRIIKVKQKAERKHKHTHSLIFVQFYSHTVFSLSKKHPNSSTLHPEAVTSYANQWIVFLISILRARELTSIFSSIFAWEIEKCWKLQQWWAMSDSHPISTAAATAPRRSYLFCPATPRLLSPETTAQSRCWWGFRASSRKLLASVDGIGWYDFTAKFAFSSFVFSLNFVIFNLLIGAMCFGSYLFLLDSFSFDFGTKKVSIFGKILMLLVPL